MTATCEVLMMAKPTCGGVLPAGAAPNEGLAQASAREILKSNERNMVT
jgi:hypothetical protein